MSVRQKVFINGISGLLGHALALRLRRDYLVSGACFRNQVHIPDVQVYPVTLKNVEVLEALVRVQRPDFVISAVGINDRKEVDELPKVSDMVNVMLPVSLAILSSRLKAKYIALSCAEVYDGERGGYSEDSTEFTLTDSVGKQKIAAHSFIRAQTLESTVLRVGRVLGIGHPYRASFFDRIRSSAAARRSYEASRKKIRSYISTASFVRGVEELLKLEFPSRHRTFHLGGANMPEFDMVRSWYELTGKDPKLVSELADTKRDLSLSSAQLEASCPAWKAESARQLFENLLLDLNPAVGLKRWKKPLERVFTGA